MALNRGLILHHVMSSDRFPKGSDARQRLLDAVPDDTHALLQEPLLSASWYDERHAVALSRAVADVLALDDAGVVDFFRELQLGAYGAVYKMILPFMSPGTLMDRAPWFWSRQHDTGELVVDEKGERHAAGRIVRNENACDEVYSLAILGGMQASVMLTGATGVRGERRIDREAPEPRVTFRVEWD